MFITLNLEWPPIDYLLHEWINGSPNPSNLVSSIPPGCHSLSLLVTLNTVGPQVKEALSQACRFYACSFPQPEMDSPPLPSTGPLHRSLDIQGCGGQIYKLFTRQEWPAQGATRSTNICLGSTSQAVRSRMGLQVPRKKGGRHLFQIFMKVLKGCCGPVDISSPGGPLPIPQSNWGSTHNVQSCLFSPRGCEFFHCRAVLLEVVSFIRTVPGHSGGLRNVYWMTEWIMTEL